MSISDITLPSRLEGLSDSESAEYVRLAEVWKKTESSNSTRMQYYLGHNPLKDLGIAIPPSLKKTSTVVGWPAKAVDMLAARSMFDGFVSEAVDEDDDLFGLQKVLDDNQFSAAYEQGVRSQLIHCTVFWTVSPGDTAAGEPEVLISLRSAEFAAGLWDFRRQRIRAGMAIVDVSPDAPHLPVELNLYFDDWTITAKRGDDNVWRCERVENVLGRPAMEPMPFLPDFQRPFGRSRITREVMSITDSAQRGALRSEVLMEANTAPQKALIGVEDDLFDETRWRTYLTSMLALSQNENGENPQLTQLPQLTPQGAILYMQHLAMRFAGATGVPVSSLGVVQENPASAQAIFAAKDDLVTTAQALNRYNQLSLVNLARMVIATLRNVPVMNLSTEERSLQARFRNPGMPSIVSQSDAMVKQISAIPWLAETEVALEELGYDKSQILRLAADRRRAEGRGIIEALSEDRRSVKTQKVKVEEGLTDAEIGPDVS